MPFEIVRLDFWDYRFPTGQIFENSGEAEMAADHLNHINLDPFNCYIVVERHDAS
jgi:hypothetical protein